MFQGFDRSREVVERLDQGVRSGGQQFLAAAIAPQHTDGRHPVQSCTVDVVPSVAYHRRRVGRDALPLQHVADQLALVRALACELGAIDASEVLQNPEVTSGNGVERVAASTAAYRIGPRPAGSVMRFPQYSA